MNIARQRIDKGCVSTRVDNKTNIRIDALDILIPVEGKTNTKTQEMRDRIADAINRIEGNKIYTVERKRRTNDYIRCMTIKLRSNKDCYITLECLPISNNRSFLKLKLSPQHWRIDELNAMLLFIFGFINRMTIRLLKKAYISRIDLAIDIDEHIMSDVIVGFDGIRSGHITANTAPYGLKLGGNNSIFCLSVYEKYTFTGDKAPKGTSKGVVRVKDEDVIPFTRFEIRHRPKKNKLLLSDLNSMNEFVSKLHIYDHGAVLTRARTHVGFKQGIPSMTLPEVWKAYYADTSRKGRERKQKMMKILESNKWNFGPERIWKCWPECVSKLGLLAQPDLWNEC